MKKLLLLVALAMPLFLASCKKSSNKSDSAAPLEIRVKDLTDKTSLSMKIVDQNNKTVFTITNKFGNQTYYTDDVKSKDILKVHFSSNIASDLDGNGSGSISYWYKGESRGGSSGGLGFKAGNNTTVVIP